METETTYGNEAPGGWITCKLPDFCDLIMGQSPPSSTYNTKKNGLPFYQGKSEFGYLYPKPEKYCNQPNKIAEEGDILLSIRAPVGPTNIAPHKACIGRGLAAIRPFDNIPTKFLLYAFRSIEPIISKKGTGTTFKAITKDFLQTLSFNIPPLPEQHRIVAKIEELFSDLDDGVASLKKAQAQLKIYRQAVLKYAFEGKLTAEWRTQHADTIEPAEHLLERIKQERQRHYAQQLDDWQQAVKEWEANGKSGKKPAKPKKPKELPPLTEAELAELSELPEGWEWERLCNFAELIGGVTKGRKLEGKETIELPYLRVANVQDGYLDLSQIKYIKVLKTDLDKYHLEYGDVLYTEGGDKDKLGRGTVWKNEIQNCIHQNHIFRARLFRRLVDSKFVAYFSQAQTAKDYFFRHAKQTVNLASINLTILSNFPIPLPSQNEQHQIVAEIESRLSVCDKLEQTIEESLRKADALRQSILKRAFEGKLVPQDPNDEPAEQLLERIQDSRKKNDRD